MYGLDYHREGMLVAIIAHPPAFGMKLKSVDDAVAKTMPGVKDVFTMKTYNEDYQLQWSDVNTFPDLVVVVVYSTWEVLNAKKALNIQWQSIGSDHKDVPSALESSTGHIADA